MIGISKWLLSVASFFLCFLGWPNAFIYVILFACYATKFKQPLLRDTRISIIYNNRNKVTYGMCVGVFVCDMYLCMCVWNGMALTRIKLLESDWNAFESHWRFIEQTLCFHLPEPSFSLAIVISIIFIYHFCYFVSEYSPIEISIGCSRSLFLPSYSQFFLLWSH